MMLDVPVVARVSEPPGLLASPWRTGRKPARPKQFEFQDQFQRSVAQAALGTLVVANVVGVWLATLLLWPQLGRLAGPLTYGRWVPLHLDLQLYGWCSLPLIGLLLARFLPTGPAALAAARVALACWCGALAAGALTWLGGHTSGKIFLDWTGPAGFAFTCAQLCLWGVLAGGWWARRRDQVGGLRPLSWRGTTDGALLVILLAVPVALLFAAHPSTYPPVNPRSGGATGHSLLASSLGIVGLALALPALLGRPAVRAVRGPLAGLLAGYVANWVLYLVLDHGNASNRDPGQIAGLASLLVWPLWLVWWFRHYAWTPAHRRWLGAAAAWAALLVIDGFALFLPGALERAKFTNALVAHSHLAMAGLLTSLNLLMLISLAPASRLATALAGRRSWLAWNAACLLMVVVLTALGWSEGASPRLIADNGPGVTPAYLARLTAGLVMLGASVSWWRASARPVLSR